MQQSKNVIKTIKAAKAERDNAEQYAMLREERKADAKRQREESRKAKREMFN